jgi:hypothetical protein
VATTNREKGNILYIHMLLTGQLGGGWCPPRWGPRLVADERKTYRRAGEVLDGDAERVERDSRLERCRMGGPPPDTAWLVGFSLGGCSPSDTLTRPRLGNLVRFRTRKPWHLSSPRARIETNAREIPARGAQIPPRLQLGRAGAGNALRRRAPWSRARDLAPPNNLWACRTGWFFKCWLNLILHTEVKKVLLVITFLFYLYKNTTL